MSSKKFDPISTDMLVGMGANSEKILPSEKRVDYKKGDYNDDDDFEVNKLDVDMKDNIFRKNDNTEKEHEADKYTNDKTYSDKYEKTEKESKMDEKLLKRDMLRKLAELKSYGVKISENYSMSSNLDDMQNEYQLHYDLRSKQTSVQIMSHLLVGVLKASEVVNDNYNPFDIKLEGLSNVVQSDIQSYYVVLGDIYEKYNKPGKPSAPELRLLLLICGTIMSMQLNRATGIGNLSDKIKKDDTVLEELRKKAKNETFMKEEHEKVSKKLSDVKNIKDKEQELNTVNELQKDNVAKTFKNKLIMSSEQPKHDNDNDSDSDSYLDNKNIDKQKIYENEQKHLEQVRLLAQKKSDKYRQELKKNNVKPDLTKQNKLLDDILNSDNVSEKSNKSNKSNKSDKSYRTNSSDKSSKSRASFHPDIENILKKTKSSDIKYDKNITDILSNDSNKGKNTDLIDFGKLSIGSASKGKKPLINFGKNKN
jgi:hypothetical protein